MKLDFVLLEAGIMLQVSSGPEGRLESALEMVYEMYCMGTTFGLGAHEDAYH